MRARDGVFAERYWSSCTHPILDQRTGKLPYLLHTTTDETDRVERERELEGATRRYSSSLPGLHIGAACSGTEIAGASRPIAGEPGSARPGAEACVRGPCARQHR